MKRLALLTILLFVSGCAMPLKSGELAPSFDFYDQLEDTHFEDAVYVRDVTVSESVTGTFTIPPEELRAALIVALRQAVIYRKLDDSQYYLNVHMAALDQPVFGFNMTATATIEYSVHKNDDDDIVYRESLTLPCTKTMADAFNGSIRARLANGCAVGENITHFIKSLALSS